MVPLRMIQLFDLLHFSAGPLTVSYKDRCRVFDLHPSDDETVLERKNNYFKSVEYR